MPAFPCSLKSHGALRLGCKFSVDSKQPLTFSQRERKGFVLVINKECTFLLLFFFFFPVLQRYMREGTLHDEAVT